MCIMNKNIALVIGSFHEKEADEMVDEARAAAEANDLTIVEEVRVPGSIE
jgi:6,7-dimethyl-8-ribityllumazine synthase